MTKEKNSCEPSSCYWFSLSEPEYDGLLKTIAENQRDSFRQEWETLTSSNEQLWQGKPYCLILPGSDGKGERHPQSKTEVIILLGHNGADCERLIKQEIEGLGKEDLLGQIETKKLSSPEQIHLSFFNYSPFGANDEVYPDRVLNSYFLAGDPCLYFQARRQILKEMTGKKIKEAMRDQLRQYKKVIRTGEYRNLKVFSEEEGEQYYFESHETKRIRFGFKVGFLRAVQRKLDLETVRWLESGKEGVDFLAQNLPTSTVERIAYFAQRGLFDQNFALNLQKAYLWFLKNYHYAQETFSRDKGRVAVVPFSQERFAVEKEVITNFLAG